MAFKPKFKIGDCVELSQSGASRYWFLKTSSKSKVLAVNDYWDGGKNRKEYRVEVLNITQPQRGYYPHWFKSHELRLSKGESLIGIEELI